ncbi:MAG TPA: MFS transporter [Burkholderiaceae bacterium]|nr:MFS transporter [Burkholderiaceae bacterium]
MASSTVEPLAAVDASTGAQARSDRSFFGHPKGLGWLCACEFWERFSYYGMQALLVLYMTHWLLQPEHVGAVAGFGPFRQLVEWAYGPLTPQALGSAIFGLYSGLVYVTPIAGGVLAERWIGRTAAVTLGASLMALGHFLMAFDASFLAALACLLAGTGCFKGNIASQVGDLYRPGDLRRATAFQYYLFTVQVAVIVTPLVCGGLADTLGWHWGFGAAGIGMLIGLAVYLAGRSTLPPEPARGRARAAAPARPPLTLPERRNLALLLALLPVLALALVANQQLFNVYLLWAETHYRLVAFGHHVPVTWILSIGSIVSASSIVASTAFWRWWARRRREPDELLKTALGVVLAIGAPLLLAAMSAWVAADGGRPLSLGWAVVLAIVNDLAFANVFPIAMALYSRASPPGWTGVVMGVFFLHLFLCNVTVGWLGGLAGKMSSTDFWLMHAAIVGGAACLLLLARFTVGRNLAAPLPGRAPLPLGETT